MTSKKNVFVEGYSRSRAVTLLKISSCWVYLQLAELEGRLELNKTRKFFFQCAKKVVSDIPGLVDSAFGLVNSVSNLPDGQEN